MESEKTVTIPALQQMKREGKKIVGVVAWDYQIAQIIDRAGVDIISVGETVGINLWGHPNPLEVTLEEMIVVCKAVRRGTKRALVSCDFPFGPLQEGAEGDHRARDRQIEEGGDVGEGGVEDERISGDGRQQRHEDGAVEHRPGVQRHDL